MYLAVINNGVVERNREIWQLRVPLKIKKFIWYLYKGVVLTKDNLVKRNWTGSKHCSFCMTNETIQHLFFDCVDARYLTTPQFSPELGGTEYQRSDRQISP
jgi:hypothetical protein